MIQKVRGVLAPRRATMYFLKCLVSDNRENTNHEKKQESVIHTLWKNRPQKLPVKETKYQIYQKKTLK